MSEPTDDGGGRVRWGDGDGPFAIVPAWVFESEIGDKAVRLYAILARYASRESGEAIASRKTFAERLRCAPSTFDVAVKELVEIGAVSIEPRYTQEGDRTSNSYVVHRGRSTDTPVDGSTDTPVGEKREVSTDLEETTSKTEVVSRPVDLVPSISMIGGRNIPLDTLVTVCGIDPQNTLRVRQAAVALNGKRNKKTGKVTTQGIADLWWIEANRWCVVNKRPDLIEKLRTENGTLCDLLSHSIERKAAVYREKLDGATLTPSALQKWWLDLELQPARRTRGGVTSDDIRSGRV